MKYYPLPDRPPFRNGFCVFLFAALMLARDTLFNGVFLGFYKAQFLFLALFGAAVLGYLWLNRRDIKALVFDRRMAFAAACSAMVLLPMLVKRDWQLMYFSILICFFFAIFLTYFATVRQTARCYVQILCVLGLYSIVTTYGIRFLADAGILVPQVLDRGDGVTFYNYGLSYVSIWYVKSRNFGIFREPGVYQYYLMLAIFLNNYIVDWESPKQLWIANGILAVTMLSTFATGGVIELALFCGVIYLDKKWYTTRRGRIIALSAIALVVLAAAAIIIQHGSMYEELYMMFYKFFDKDTDSVVDRVGSVTANLNLFLHSPLVGAGIAETLYAVENNTSSSLILFAILGAVGGLFHVFSWFVLVWDRQRKLIWNLALTAILAMSFNTQSLIADTFFWLFPVMAVTERILPLFGKKEEAE